MAGHLDCLTEWGCEPPGTHHTSPAVDLPSRGCPESDKSRSHTMDSIPLGIQGSGKKAAEDQGDPCAATDGASNLPHTIQHWR